VQPIEIQRFPDRHFWHAGYGKAYCVIDGPPTLIGRPTKGFVRKWPKTEATMPE